MATDRPDAVAPVDEAVGKGCANSQVRGGQVQRGGSVEQRAEQRMGRRLEGGAEDAEKMEREREGRRKPERERSGPPPPPELLPSSPRPEAGRQRERSSREQRRAPLTRPTHGSQYMKYHTHMKYYTYMNFMS